MHPGRAPAPGAVGEDKTVPTTDLCVAEGDGVPDRGKSGAA